MLFSARPRAVFYLIVSYNVMLYLKRFNFSKNSGLFTSAQASSNHDGSFSRWAPNNQRRKRGDNLIKELFLWV